MEVGTVRRLTGRVGPSPSKTEPGRGAIRVVTRARLDVVPGDRTGSALSSATEERVEFRCTGCGYGIVVSGSLPLCPMCRSSDWEEQRDS
jgi:hypothetical protein